MYKTIKIRLSKLQTPIAVLWNVVRRYVLVKKYLIYGTHLIFLLVYRNTVGHCVKTGWDQYGHKDLYLLARTWDAGRWLGTEIKWNLYGALTSDQVWPRLLLVLQSVYQRQQKEILPGGWGGIDQMYWSQWRWGIGEGGQGAFLPEPGGGGGLTDIPNPPSNLAGGLAPPAPLFRRLCLLSMIWLWKQPTGVLVINALSK